MPAAGLNFVAMAREGIMLFVLDGANSNPVARGLQRESPFGVIFGAYVNRLGYAGKATRFFYLNVVVKWDSTPEDIGLADGGRINVVLFGWLFNVLDLGYFDQWGEPPSLRIGIYSREAPRAEGG